MGGYVIAGIGADALGGRSPSTVVVPASVTAVADGAFAIAGAEVYFKGVTPPVVGSPYGNADVITFIYAVDGKVPKAWKPQIEGSLFRKTATWQGRPIFCIDWIPIPDTTVIIVR